MGNVRSLAVGCAIWLAAAQGAMAGVSPLIRYQGTLVDANNVPLEGSYPLTFRVYNAATGGTALWTETQTAVPVSRGIFNVLLGQVTALSLPFDTDYWLTTQIGADAEMSPRQRLTSVPYAYRASVADAVAAQPPGFTAESSSNSTLTDGLIAYWKLEEVAGARDDQLGPQDLADYNTVTSAPGRQGSAAQFARANSEHLSVADHADLRVGNGSFTLAAWAYLDSIAPGTKGALVGKTNGMTHGYSLTWGNFDANRFDFYIQKSGGYAFVSSHTFGDLAAGTWYLVIGWFDAAAGTINIQVNNGAIDSVPTTVVQEDGATSFNIGSESGSGTFWNGRIDEVGFWKRVLTAQERAELYNTGQGNTYSLGKAANPWTQAESGITYTAGRLGIGTLSLPNILSVQQGSATDPIADSWTVYPCDRQHKHLLHPAPSGYLAALKAIPLYEWKRAPSASDDEAKHALRKSRPTPEELHEKKRELTQAKAVLPKFTTTRVGLAIDDADVPDAVLTFNPDGTKAGIDLLAYVGYLHAALKETALQLEELEARLPKK